MGWSLVKSLRSNIKSGGSQSLWRDLRTALNLVTLFSLLLITYSATVDDDGLTCGHTEAGYECPSCGLTGSLQLVVRGEFDGSTVAHPAGIWIAVWGTIVLLSRPLMWKTFRPSLVLIDVSLIFGCWIGISLWFF